MSLNSQLAAICIVAGTLLLTACNSNQPKPEEQQAQTSNGNGNGNSNTATRPADPSRPSQASAPAPKPPVAVPNPSLVTFQKMAVALDAATKQAVDQLVERARASSKVTLTGYCDRSQIANPTDAAVARALAVRDELAMLGVPLAIMQVKIDVKTPKKHAVEVRFD